YDYSCGSFSPDGRIFQVEYAAKAVENSGTSIGIRCSDGVVIAVEKPLISKMLVAGSNRRAFGIAPHAGIVVTGFVADGRQIVNRARDEARSYMEVYGHPIVPSILANRLALYVHYFTTHGALRPFGSTAIVASYDNDLKTHCLHMVEPSGNCFQYYGCAAGKGAQASKTEVEKVLSRSQTITCREAVKELAR
ncbi:PAG1, partial [Symbiodinium microadriaticum]